ncbi:MAG: PQQ-dependent sugar dehydrogenase [Rhodospirillales bacterium]|nr:PQQ-dependent sugar dehydrogenase [Rhodospirillales bacterium]
MVQRGRTTVSRIGALAAAVALSAAFALTVACAAAADREVDTEAGKLGVETVVGGLDHPWGLTFLPDGRMLVTERAGRLRLVAGGALSKPLSGVPMVFTQGQGGLLDVALDPEFATNRLVYLCYAEPGEGGASTAAGRGRLDAEARGLNDFKVILRQTPKVGGGNHFGCRLAFAPDGKLFVTTGERFKFEPAQDLESGLGKIFRINPDGSVPPDNPFVGRSDAQPAIWSYGHRNVQGAAINPATGALWTDEFGPRGGDELNIPKSGGNYGWPIVSWGRHYSGADIPDPPSRPDLADAIYHWNPVISPSGMTFYTGALIPAWRGNLLIGGLSSEGVVRLVLDGDKVTHEERIDLDARIRNVRQGPDGAVYVLTDEADGAILRLAPAKAAPQ